MSEQINSIEPISSFRLMHGARQERSALMAAYLRSGAAYIATSLGGYVRYFAELARRLAHELYLRNATRTLQQSDDHILADIGLRRGEIEYAVRNGRLGAREIQSQCGPGAIRVTLPSRRKLLDKARTRPPASARHDR